MAAQESISEMAGRYATALFELALERKSLDAVKADFDRFDALMVESADLDRLVRSPVFTAGEQVKALSPVLKKAAISDLTAKFLGVVAANRRLFAVRQIMKAFRTLVARHKGEITAEVTVAEKLDDRHLEALKAVLRGATGGKDVTLDVTIDPSIIGGLVVKLGSRMIDTSLRTRLNLIKHAMKETG
jgi:F-type H+-transporting ATPase subunit delta